MPESSHPPLKNLEQLVDECRALYQSLRQQMNERWNRDLPLEEILFDRWERARHLGFGERSSIYHSSLVYGKVTVGADTWIGPNTLLDGSGGGLSIGHHCSISAGVQIYSHDTVRWAISGGQCPADTARVAIGDCCYIGAQTVICKGVSVGHHCIVGAHSLVLRDLPPYAVAFGSPAVIRGQVNLNTLNWTINRSPPEPKP